MTGEQLTAEFEEQRPHLRAVAYRMLGSASEADDAVQEAWLRASRADTSDVEDTRAWLTTVVRRIVAMDVFADPERLGRLDLGNPRLTVATSSIASRG